MLLKSTRRAIGASRFAADERGASAVEFAFAAPVLLLLLSGVIDLGLALNQSSSLSNAARAGAQYGIRFPSDKDGITQVVSKTLNQDPATLTVASEVNCECSDGMAITCGEICIGTTNRSYISVNVTMPYSSPLPTGLILGPISITGSAVFRAN